MESFPAWDQEVLDKCYDVVDYVSVHHYHSAPPGDMGALLGGSLYYEDFINTEIAMIDYVASKHRSPRKVMLSIEAIAKISLSPLISRASKDTDP